MVYPYNAILFSNEKESTIDTWYKIDESWRLHILGFYLYEMREGKSTGTENRLEGFWSWGYERIDYKQAYGIFLKHCKTVLKLDHGNGVKFYTF